MAEMVSSAVVQETVSQILSGLVHRYEEKEKSNANRNLERLEMAHIRLEAALETSDKWQITDASLLRWRRKLKGAAQECDDTLHKYKQRILEGEQMEQEVRRSSLPSRIAHATKSFVFSVFNHDNNKLSRSTVQRFEWYADGASEFLRFIELGGTPRRHMPFYSLIKHLFAGKELHHKIVRGNEHPSFLLWLAPFSTADHGIEITLKMIHKDDNIYFSMALQLSESTDIVGIAIKCLQLFAPHFKSTVEIVTKELTQLPTQDLSWVPSVYSCQKEHWDNLHSLGTQWFRPNPLCCKQHDQHELHRIGNIGMEGLPNISLEPVIEVTLKCQVSASEYSRHRNSLSEAKISLQDSQHVKVGLFFMPHGSSEYLLPADKSSALMAIDGEEQHCLHTDITLEQVEEIILQTAIDYFHQNAEATVYQMLWKSKHGTAYIQVEKESMKVPSTRRTSGGGRKRKLLQRQNEELGSQANAISQFVDLWVAHAPVQVRGSIVDWIQKGRESQLAAPPLRLKF